MGDVTVFFLCPNFLWERTGLHGSGSKGICPVSRAGYGLAVVKAEY